MITIPSSNLLRRKPPQTITLFIYTFQQTLRRDARLVRPLNIKIKIKSQASKITKATNITKSSIKSRATSITIATTNSTPSTTKPPPQNSEAFQILQNIQQTKKIGKATNDFADFISHSTCFCLSYK